MATQNSINSNIPIQTTLGGTQNTAFTTDGVVYYDGTKLNSVAGSATTVLTSQGSGNAPIFSNLPTFFTLVAGDPVMPSAGDTWYNTVTNEYRGCINGGSGTAWVVVASLNTAVQATYGAGTSGGNSISAGGQSSVSPYYIVNTEIYSGTSNTWTNLANRNYGVPSGAGSGTASNALVFGGYYLGYSGITESYNGTTWTVVSPLNTGRDYLAGAGSGSTDALSFGGSNSSSNPGFALNTTEYYNGTSWTSKLGLNTRRLQLEGCGTSGSSALAWGGRSFVSNITYPVSTEQFSIGAWFYVNNLVTNQFFGASAGSVSGALSYGGLTGASGSPLTLSQIYDGTSWSLTSSLNYAVYQNGGAGNSSDALSFGGSNPSISQTSRAERFGGTSATNVTFELT